MKKINNILLLIILLFFIQNNLSAQKIFSEGILKYNVYINKETSPGGIYLISIKNGNIKRELAMNNGYNNITIFNNKTGKTLSLNTNDGNKYALELSQSEVNEKNTKFLNAQFTNLNLTKKIATYDCIANNIKYTNGESADFYYTKDLLPPNESFNAMFPGLKGLPLEYEIKSNNNIIMKFVCVLIDKMAIDSKIFDIPADYKIVTKSELEKLK